MITYKTIFTHWHDFDEQERTRHLKERNYSLVYDPITETEKQQLVEYILEDNFCSKNYPLLLSIELNLPISVSAFNDAMRNPLAWPLLEKTARYYAEKNPEIFKVFIASFVFHAPQGFYKDKACTLSFVQLVHVASEDIRMRPEFMKYLLKIRHPFLQEPDLQLSLLPLLHKDWVHNSYLMDIFETLSNAPGAFERLHQAIESSISEYPEWALQYYLYFPERGSAEAKRKALLHYWSKDVPPYFQKNEMLGVVNNISWPQRINDAIAVRKNALAVLEEYYDVNLTHYVDGYCQTKKMLPELTVQQYVRRTQDYQEEHLHF